MNANELADELENDYWDSRANKIMLESAKMLRNQQALIENLNGRIERIIENQSHHEGIAHAGGYETGYEAGRKMGMKQERALWELAASTQEAYILEIEKGLESSLNLNKAQVERND
jgi:hypothetical protein